MFEKYVEAARQTIFDARHAALDRKAAAIEPVHLLLGALDADPATVKNLSTGENVDVEALGNHLQSLLPPTDKEKATSELPFSPEAKQVLMYAHEVSQRYQQQHIGVEHLLIGLLIRFPIRHYAIAEIQAVITYSNDVIELSAFSEKVLSPLLTNSRNSFNVFGSYSESQSFNSLQNLSIGFSSGEFAGKNINTMFSAAFNFSVVCDEALSTNIICKLSSSCPANSSMNTCIVSVSKLGSSNIKLFPLSGSIMPNK
jgi:hypothetical protein